jgi:aquaporin Z
MTSTSGADGPLRAILALEPPFGPRFDRPLIEWRRLFAEVTGTFLLVLVAAGAPVVNAVSGGAVSLNAQVVAPGLMVMALIYAIGAVGGAHLNPAVTVCFAVRGNFPWIRVPGYITAQLIGAVLAAGCLRATFGSVGQLGATLPGPGITGQQALVTEMLLTFGLVTVILGTASGARNIGTNAALAVGAYVALAGMWAAPISGASMNPARSLGPALIGSQWRSWWVYLAGPLAGGLLAVGTAWLLRGPPTPAGTRAAQGDLEDEAETDQAIRST